MGTDFYKVLLVDANYSVFIDGLSQVGKAYGVSLVPFYSFEAGLAFMSDNAGRVDAVLLDLNQAGSYSSVLAAVIALNTKDDLLPVIILPAENSQADTSAAIACMKAGAYNYLSKANFDPTALFKMLKVAIEQSRARSRVRRYDLLKEAYATRLPDYKRMLYTCEMILKNSLNNKLMIAPTIERRVKTFQSFYEKLTKKEVIERTITDPFSRFTDIAGLRLIFYNSADLQTAIKLLRESGDFINAKTNGDVLSDDKSKAFGYRAVHFDVKLNSAKRMHLQEYRNLSDIPCELQFKTIFAHSWSKIYHKLSYKDAEEVKVSMEMQEKLNNDFKQAALELENIEARIARLCLNYYSGK